MMRYFLFDSTVSRLAYSEYMHLQGALNIVVDAVFDIWSGAELL